MNTLPQSQQPRSDDPEYWGVWIGTDEEGDPILRKTDWQKVAEDWQAVPANDSDDTRET